MKKILCCLLAILILCCSCTETEQTAETKQTKEETKEENTMTEETLIDETEAVTEGNPYVPEERISLSTLFQSNMVLQRDTKFTVFGTGNGSGSITIGDVTKEFTSVDGEWEVEFEPLSATTEPITFIAQLGSRKKVLRNVVVGDVYLASGQSNMDVKISYSEQNNPTMTSATVRFRGRDTVGWYELEGSNCNNTTAVGMLTAMGLDVALNGTIPIGIIPAAVGGTRVEEWTSAEYSDREPYISYRSNPHSDYDRINADKKAENLHWCYTTYIEPLLKIKFAGVLWYQGESNRGIGEACYYDELFANLVENWRDAFGNENLPFYTVQIMLFSKDNTKDANGNAVDEYNIRIGQWKSAMNLKNVTLCTMLSYEDTVNEDDDLNIHPTDKQPVADALVNAILTEYYAKKGEYQATPEYSGPMAKGFSQSGTSVTVTFEHTGDGLMLTSGNTVSELEVRIDGNWIPATDAVISGNAVVITVANGQTVTGVRMAYRNRPTINLYNTKAGARLYCASPFELISE